MSEPLLRLEVRQIGTKFVVTSDDPKGLFIASATISEALSHVEPVSKLLQALECENAVVEDMPEPNGTVQEQAFRALTD